MFKGLSLLLKRLFVVRDRVNPEKTDCLKSQDTVFLLFTQEDPMIALGVFFYV